MPVNDMADESIKQVLETYFIRGYCDNIETVNRYRREARKRFPDWLEFMESTTKIREQFTADEIKQIAKGDRRQPTRKKAISFSGEVFRFAHITDTHIGAVYFKGDIWDAVVSEINGSHIDAVFHTGDVTEGLINSRTDMIYDATHIGYAQQKDYAIELLSMIEPPIYAVDGNHDRFFKKSAGACIVSDIAREVEGMEYLGEDMADFAVNGSVIRLWHGEDGSSYASSYRLQKLIEAFTGGDKPHVLLAGHTHKSIYMFDRNIHVVSGGAVTTQSNWMKRKRLANHTGFWICEMTMNQRGIVKFTSTWYPFYE